MIGDPTAVDDAVADDDLLDHSDPADEELDSPDPEGAPDEPVRRSVPWRRIGAIAAVVVTLGLLGGMWTLASPVGSAPDDGFHLPSIWCSPTAPDAACDDQGWSYAVGKTFVDVPAEIGPGAHCYAFDWLNSAACQDDIEDGTFVRTLANDGLYPGLYYGIVGVTVGDDPIDSALRARMFAWTLSMGLLVAGWFVLPREQRVAYLLVLFVVAVPLNLFLWASTNPSGLVVSAVSAAWCAAVGLFAARDRRALIGPVTLLVLATIAAAGSRADGGIYLFIAVVTASALLWRRDRDTMIRAGSVVGVAAIGLLVSFVVLTRRVDGAGELVSAGPTPDGVTSTLWSNFAEIPFFITGNLGQARLGWLDTFMPHFVFVPSFVVFFGLLFWGVGRMNRLKALALVGVLAGLLVWPYFLLWRGSDIVGEEVQPRYVLPLVPILGFTALYRRRGSTPRGLTALQIGIVLALMTVAQAVALHTNIRRYVTGADVKSIDLNTGSEWWWDLSVSPNTVWVLGSVAFAAVAAGLGWLWYSDRPDAVDVAADVDPASEVEPADTYA